MKKILVSLLVITLFISSCNQRFFNYKDYSPSYTIQTSNPNLSSQYNKILSSSPVPLYIMSMDAFSKQFLSKTNVSDSLITWQNGSKTFISLMGLYVPYHNVSGWKKPFIYLNSELSSSAIISTFYHETGHYNCVKTQCDCLKVKNLSLMEYHAFINEIDKGIENDTPYYILFSLNSFMKYINTFPEYSEYNIAVKMIYKNGYWAKAENYLKSKGFKNIPSYEISKKKSFNPFIYDKNIHWIFKIK